MATHRPVKGLVDGGLVHGGPGQRKRIERLLLDSGAWVLYAQSVFGCPIMGFIREAGAMPARSTPL